MQHFQLSDSTVFVIIVMFQVAFTSVSNIVCFQCLKLDCLDISLDCKTIKSFVTSELRVYHNLTKPLTSCPRFNETFIYVNTKESDKEPCKKKLIDKTTCSVTDRIRIQLINTTTTGGVTTDHDYYASIVGCDTDHFSEILNENHTHLLSDRCNDNQTDLQKEDDTDKRILKEYECTNISTHCYDDHCVEFMRKSIKGVVETEKEKEFPCYWIIGNFCIVMYIGVIIGFIVCRGERPSRN